MKRAFGIFGILLLALGVASLAFLSFKLFERNRSLEAEILAQRESLQMREDVLKGNFLEGGDASAIAGNEKYFDAKSRLVREGADFVNVDLEAMQITLFEDGREKQKFPVLTKGREGSWWETPTGEYSALLKSSNHFSSIGKVWMPWSIQFYGNFFIHGWPYHTDGSPVPQSYSGGCVRLSTDDAKKVYEFVSRGMPILIYEEKPGRTASLILPLNVQASPPSISAEAAIVADLDTGDVLLDKNADTPLSEASLTKLMTGVVASELIYLERGITISPSMMQDPVQSYPLQIGKSYKAFDLLYPLLMQSSNGAARSLASFLGEREFVRQMNEKAKTLGMTSSVYADASGILDENTASMKDLAKLAKYILDKRVFLFDVTRGKQLSVFSEGELSKIKNFNEFAEDPRLIGMKNGKTSTAGESLLAVFLMKTPDGAEHRMLYGVLKSEDRRKDIESLISWSGNAFGLK